MAARIVIIIIFFIFILPLIFPSKIQAQVVINEISPTTSPEWVELYKTESGEISLENCSLFLDDSSSSQKIEFTAENKILESEKYLFIDWSSNWLNNSGDLVVFECPNFSDSIAYGNQSGSVVKAPNSDHPTIGRSPDGSGNVVILDSSSPGITNSEPLPTPIPTPVPTPKPTSVPTTVPTQTPTYEPTPTPSPAPTSVPRSTPLPTKKPTLRPTTADILGLASPAGEWETAGISGAENNAQSQEKADADPTKKQNSPYTLSLIITLSGCLLVAVAAIPYLKSYFQKKNKENPETDEEIIDAEEL